MADRREYFVSSFGVPRFAVSLGQREVDLFHLLNEPATNISVVGLIGMPGIGKTTLASQFFQSRRNTFEKSSFLDNIRSRHTEDIQRQLLFDLCGTVDWDKSKYAMKIRHCITTMKVLIVADDVGSEEDLISLQFSAFKTPNSNPKKQSKGIVTGHDWQVMQEFVASHGCVHVSALDEMDAMALFSHYAFDGAKVERERGKLIHQLMVRDGRSHKHAEHHPNVEKLGREFETLAGEIVHLCAGNPLSLQVVGEFLSRKKNLFPTAEVLEMYKEALFKLRHAQVLGGGKSNDKLWTRLWDRYHDLDRPEMEMFVDFACFGFGGVEESSASTNQLTVSRESFVKHSKSGSPRISLQNLIDKSFIVVKPGGLLSMHNHLRDMGRRIAREKLVEKTSALAISNE